MPLIGLVARLIPILVLVALPGLAQAQPTFSVGTTTVSPNPVQQGVSITLTTSVTNTSSTLASGIIVDEEIYDANDVKVNQGTTSGQQYTPGQTFQPGETRTYQWFWTIPTTLPNGVYTVKIGVFQDHWSQNYAWINPATTFRVQGSGPTVGFSIGAITASPSAIQPGQSTTVTARVTNVGTAAASGINVVFDLRDPLDQSFTGSNGGPSNQAFAPGEARTYTFPVTMPAGARQGVYSAAVGVFNASYSVRYAWQQNTQAVTVGTVVDPTFAVRSVIASPVQLTHGQSLTVTFDVANTSTQTAPAVNVDVEIRNSADTKVLQQYEQNQSFAAGQSRPYTFGIMIPTTMPTATYTVNIAIFDPNWTKIYTFSYHAASFTVTATAPGSSSLNVSRTGAGSGIVTSSPPGIDCGSDCSGTYPTGTVVQLTATPATGSQFAGWSGPADCADGVITLSVSMTCTATFAIQGPTPPPPPPGPGHPGLVVTGPGAGLASQVRVFADLAATAVSSVTAYNPGFRGGVFVAVGHVLAAGEAAIVTGVDAGGGPHVRVFRSDGSDTGISFFPYDPGFHGGVRVATCDVDGDGVDEIVTAPGPGGGPDVRIFKVAGGRVTQVGGFFAYAPSFTGGLFVGCGAVAGTGRPAIITGADAGGGPHIRVLQVTGGSFTELASFFAFDPGFTGGVRVAAADLDGSGRAVIVVGAGPGGGPHVRIFKLADDGVHALGGYFAYSPAFTGGVFVAAGPVGPGGAPAIVTGPGPGGGPHVRVVSPDFHELAAFFAYDPTFTGGVRVGAGR